MASEREKTGRLPEVAFPETLHETHAGPPARLGRYIILARIQRGGYATVYSARDKKGQLVAVKMLHGQSDKKARDRFAREQRLQADLGEADGFVPLIDANLAHEHPYIVMPFLEGGTLKSRLARGPLSVEETASLGRTLARALGRAHAHGIVHRDLKPANVLYTAEGLPLIADLGIAKRFTGDEGATTESPTLSQTGSLQGTVHYMAPEQAENAKSAGPPADVFSLGAILYECLAGRPAFPGDNVVEVLRAIIRGAPQQPIAALRPDVPAALAAIVDRALERDPSRRFGDGEEMARAFDAPFVPPHRGRAARRALAVAVASPLVVAAAVLLAPVIQSERRAARAKGFCASGVQALAQEKPGLAWTRLTRALELDPGLPDALVARAEASVAVAEPDGAIADATSALAIDPRNARAFAARAAARMKERSFTQALEDATSATALEPALARAWAIRAAAHVELGQLEAARACALHALELDAGLALAWVSRARVAISAGHAADALADAEKALELDPRDPAAYETVAAAREAREDWKGAASVSSAAVARCPRSARAWASRASARRHEGDSEGAIADASRAIEIDSSLARAWLVRGDARLARGDRAGAAADLEHFVAIAPESAADAKRAREFISKLRKRHEDDEDDDDRHEHEREREHKRAKKDREREHEKKDREREREHKKKDHEREHEREERERGDDERTAGEDDDHDHERF